MIIRILIFLFVLFALSRVTLQFRKKEVTTREFLFWGVFWILVALVGAYPEFSSRFAALVGVGRGVDAAIYVALLILFYSIFRLVVRIERLEQTITKITTAFALREDRAKEKNKP